MVNKMKKHSKILVAFTFLIIAFMSNVYASSISMGPSATLNIGGSTTISITGSDVTGRFNISSSNSGVVSLSSGSVWIENSSATVTATAKASGSATITLTPSDVSNGAGDDITGSIGSKAVTITVRAAQTTTNTTTSNTTTTTTKSSNANLKKLVPNYEGLSPNFSPSVTKYSLIVPESATSLGLTIAVEQTGAKYWVSGEDNLKMGDNTVNVTVTAPDNTKKVYTIIVTRAADVTKANANLSNIVIDGKALSPAFTAENLAYDIGTVTADVEKLTVLAYAQNEGAKIEITGNDKLVEGENIIKVKVTAVDGTTIKEYTIKVNKEAAPVVAGTTSDEVNIYSLQDTTPSKFSNFIHGLWMYLKDFWLVLSLLFVCLFELAQIIYLYIKVEKFKRLDTSKLEDKDNLEEDKTLQTRRRNVELENVKKEDPANKASDEKIDDISDELVDNSEESETDDEDSTDNFEDSIDTDDDK